MKLISWNVNGIRAAIKKGFMDFLKSENPDIICIQETKARPEQVENEFPGYPYRFWNSAEKKGYSGTAIFSKIEPIGVTYGLDISKHDTEGRVITAEFEKYYLVTVYVPNSKRDLSRLPYRQKEWDVDFLSYVRELENKKPVVFCGDMNVAQKEIDLANPKSNKKNAGFTAEERMGFDNIVKAGFVDTFRHFNPEGGFYTWWSYMAKARERNIGWRIDYFCVSPLLMKSVNHAGILPEVMGSDHCPTSLEIQI
ncbi:MAG: exodeoxyribonuclease III [Candidatus Marinimicrobia bacterium]|jgi:exodeoxyribonuclease-3|nr:exodeoxyribonuclease III [Candidatus Neomarinimicrobiota bacterium]MBT3633855.1 exodeoxyribonuclease III [Candidatus Neomarinimicrobiota bacterium]MBT3682647.1 exodeoxyribonuclease III [Candidatus Neomarinimicrobiota bacterium]MBT3759411.1 exodeoxyribonuclease III [Candidatus Neomarinimicrobiota bacterium]MBT3894581.1 exodeoxyribonuclease III [Candidatus Neomarinimicrobiota bacterium]